MEGKDLIIGQNLAGCLIVIGETQEREEGSVLSLSDVCLLLEQI